MYTSVYQRGGGENEIESEELGEEEKKEPRRQNVRGRKVNEKTRGKGSDKWRRACERRERSVAATRRTKSAGREG